MSILGFSKVGGGEDRAARSNGDRKSTGGGRRWGRGGIPRGAGAGGNRNFFVTLHNILPYEKHREAGTTMERVGTRSTRRRK